MPTPRDWRRVISYCLQQLRTAVAEVNPNLIGFAFHCFQVLSIQPPLIVSEQATRPECPDRARSFRSSHDAIRALLIASRIFTLALKETAILMLVDGVEGASRALQEPTPSRIRGLVTRIVDQRVQDGQLDECGLTLAEVARIREAFIPVLTAIFHVRAPYPATPEESRRRGRADADLRKESI